MRMKTIRAVASALTLGLGIAACSGSPAVTTEIQRVVIRTEQAPSPACMEALITGVLVPHAQWGLALQVPGSGELMQPIFPFHYSAAVDGARIALLDESGRVVAHTGDLVQSSGGNIGAEGVPIVALCDDTIEVVPG
jgi:hypothetical protein